MLEAIQLKELLAAAEGELLQHRALGEEARLRGKKRRVVAQRSAQRRAVGGAARPKACATCICANDSPDIHSSDPGSAKRLSMSATCAGGPPKAMKPSLENSLITRFRDISVSDEAARSAC